MARARGRRGVPSGTFNTMKLRSPAVEFRNSKARVCARSVADHRWYAVQGITKTLDSIAGSRKRARAHNMICMDLFARILRDLNDNPGTSLRWLLEYVVNLNAPESKAADFRAALLRLLKYKALSMKSVRRAWDANRLSPSIGIAVDAQCKDVFNGKKSADEVGPVSRVILTQLQALHLSPICAGLKVAGVPTPDRSGDGGGGRYTYHNGCVRGCRSLRGRDAFYTEVDLVAHDMVTNTVALLELKTRNNDVLDDATLWRYNTQLWLTWTMFSLTYPSAAERSSAYLVIIRPGTSTVTIRSCMRPTVSKTLRDKFPWLNCLCPQVLNCLTPACVNMRVGTRLNSGSADGRRRKRSGVDPSDLCFRNMMFNQEKARVSAAVAERKSVEN